MWKNNKFVVGLLSLIGAAVIALAAAHVTTVSCTGHKIKRRRIDTDLLCVLTVVFELTSTGLLSFACLKHIKSDGAELLLQKQSLFTFMLKDGLLYAGFVTTFTATAMALNYAAPTGSFFQRLLNALTIPISGLMAARFLLHIREWQVGDLGATTLEPGGMSFAVPLPLATLETDLALDTHVNPTLDFEEGSSSMGVYRRQGCASGMV